MSAPAAPDWDARFEDARYESRRALAELVGTFLLVLVGAGAATVNAVSGGAVGRVPEAVAPGLLVLAMVLALGPVSGAHLNPAVSLAFALRGYFPWRRVPLYVVAQIGGAILACLLLRSLFGTSGELGATRPGPGIDSAVAFVIELVLSFGLVLVILGTATRARLTGALSALAVGGYIALAGLWAGPVSDASMNPARSLGPAIVLPDLAGLWIYLVAPPLGACLAVGLTLVLYGPRGEDEGRRAAQGEGPP